MTTISLQQEVIDLLRRAGEAQDPDQRLDLAIGAAKRAADAMKVFEAAQNDAKTIVLDELRRRQATRCEGSAGIAYIPQIKPKEVWDEDALNELATGSRKGLALRQHINRLLRTCRRAWDHKQLDQFYQRTLDEIADPDLLALASALTECRKVLPGKEGGLTIK
jgi:hypothetical protein